MTTRLTKGASHEFDRHDHCGDAGAERDGRRE